MQQACATFERQIGEAHEALMMAWQRFVQLEQECEAYGERLHVKAAEAYHKHAHYVVRMRLGSVRSDVWRSVGGGVAEVVAMSVGMEEGGGEEEEEENHTLPHASATRSCASTPLTTARSEQCFSTRFRSVSGATRISDAVARF